MTRQALLLLHLLGACAWVGGMFFAHLCLRPAAVEVLAPAQRLPLWGATLARFLRYTALAVVVILATGLTLLLETGFRDAPIGWHVMFALGLVMAAIFAYAWLALYPRLRRHCAAGQWPDAAHALGAIRGLVTINLVLGVCVFAAAVSAR